MRMAMKATRYWTATSTYAKLLKTRLAMGSIPGRSNQSGIHDAPTQVATAKVAAWTCCLQARIRDSSYWKLPASFKSSNGRPPEDSASWDSWWDIAAESDFIDGG